MPFRISLSRIPFLSCTAPPGSHKPRDKAGEARELLEVFRSEGADVGRRLDAQRRVQPPPRQTLPVRNAPLTVIGLVIETTDGFRDLPAAWDHTRPSNQTEVVTVGLVANTLEPARLEKLLTRIDLVRQIPHTEIGVSAPPGLLLKELISVASQLRDTAKAGALPDDGKAAVMAACLAVAPSAQFDDMDLAALCAYDLYCRATIPAASRRQSAIAKAAQGYHGRRPEPLPEAVLAREEPRTITGKTTVTAAMPSSRPCRRWRFRQNALPPAPITAPSAAPSPSALRTMRAVQAR